MMTRVACRSLCVAAVFAASATAAFAQKVTAEFDQSVNFANSRRLRFASAMLSARALARTVQVPNMQGTLIIDIQDSSTRELVWRGVTMDDERDPVKLASKLDDMVKKTVAKYPSRK